MGAWFKKKKKTTGSGAAENSGHETIAGMLNHESKQYGQRMPLVTMRGGRATDPDSRDWTQQQNLAYSVRVCN